MLRVLPHATAPDRSLGVENGSGFEVRDRVWVKRLQQPGIVREVLACSEGTREHYVLRVAVESGEVCRVLAHPVAIEKRP